MTKTKKIKLHGLSFMTLEFGTWNLFVIWNLGFGIFLFPVTRHAAAQIIRRLGRI
jgi:hypothetical protein